MAKYLDSAGLSRVWEKIKDYISAYFLSKASVVGGFPVITSNGTISDMYVPSSVKNVIEAWPIISATPFSQGWLKDGPGDEGYVITPTSGKIYILMEDTSYSNENNMFRWNGTSYVKLA